MRQLNFYGFRKIKSDPIRINTAINDIESKYWRFRHEKFQRGRPDLLGEIRKANQTESPDKQEVDALKNEVKDLRARMANMATDIDKLTALVKNMMVVQQKQEANTQYGPEPTNKKRKVVPMPAAVPSSSVKVEAVAPIIPLHVSSLPDPSEATDADLFVEEMPTMTTEATPFAVGSMTPLSQVDRFESLGSMNSVDEDLLDLFKDEISMGNDFALSDKTVLPDVPTSHGIAYEADEERLLVHYLDDTLIVPLPAWSLAQVGVVVQGLDTGVWSGFREALEAVATAEGESFPRGSEDS